MSGVGTVDYSLWSASSWGKELIRLLRSKMRMVRCAIPLSFQVMLALSTPGKKQVWRITTWKGKSEGDYITYDGVMWVTWQKSRCSIHPIPTSKTVRNFDAVPLPWLIFQSRNISLPTCLVWLRFAYARATWQAMDDINGSQSATLPGRLGAWYLAR